MPTSDARHEKTDLKVFVVVVPKEGLAGGGLANPSLGMTNTIKYLRKILLYCLQRFYSAVGVIPKEGLAVPQPANPSLGMTTILSHLCQMCPANGIILAGL